MPPEEDEPYSGRVVTRRAEPRRVHSLPKGSHYVQDTLRATRDRLKWEAAYVALQRGGQADTTRAETIERLIEDVETVSTMFDSDWDNAVIEGKTRRWFDEHEPTVTELGLVNDIVFKSFWAKVKGLNLQDSKAPFYRQAAPNELLVLEGSMKRITRRMEDHDETLEEGFDSLGTSPLKR
jgi:hypothetical protein